MNRKLREGKKRKERKGEKEETEQGEGGREGGIEGGKEEGGNFNRDTIYFCTKQARTDEITVITAHAGYPAPLVWCPYTWSPEHWFRPDWGMPKLFQH